MWYARRFFKTLENIANALEVPLSHIFSEKNSKNVKIMEVVKELTPKQREAIYNFVDFLSDDNK